MIEPNNQKVYFVNEYELDELFPEAEDPYGEALDALEGEQSFIAINDETLPIVYIADQDAFLVGDFEVSSEAIKKAHILMDLFVKDELFSYRDIERENGFMPDEEYPMSVNFADGMTYSVESYYPSLEQMANAKVYIWSGSGYTIEPMYVNVSDADNVEEALDAAVVMAEKIAPGLLHDVGEVKEEMAADGHYDMETGEGDAIFQETYIYVDATMAGASEPYYIYAENFGVRPNDGPLA